MCVNLHADVCIHLHMKYYHLNRSASLLRLSSILVDEQEDSHFTRFFLLNTLQKMSSTLSNASVCVNIRRCIYLSIEASIE